MNEKITTKAKVGGACENQTPDCFLISCPERTARKAEPECSTFFCADPEWRVSVPWWMRVVHVCVRVRASRALPSNPRGVKPRT